MRKPNNYLISVQYLGFRYSGWQQQPGRKTIESMLTKTLLFLWPGRSFKILPASRTDARVSALQNAFELFLDGDPLPDTGGFLLEMNKNLPQDIRIIDLKEVGNDFNIIKSCREKEYVYLFAFGQKMHPFCAPFMAGIQDELDIDLMIQLAPIYEGSHDFRAYTAREERPATFNRHVHRCRIQANTLLKANFFPEKSYMLCVRGGGFMRYQVRMIMGALFNLGKGKLSPAQIKESLEPGNQTVLDSIAPGSGLLLRQVNFK